MSNVCMIILTLSIPGSNAAAQPAIGWFLLLIIRKLQIS